MEEFHERRRVADKAWSGEKVDARWTGWWCSRVSNLNKLMGNISSLYPNDNSHVETALPFTQRKGVISKSRIVKNSQKIIMAVPLPPQWVIDLNTPVPKPKTSSIPDPPGYTSSSITGKVNMPVVLQLIMLFLTLLSSPRHPRKSPSAPLQPMNKPTLSCSRKPGKLPWPH